MGRPLLKLSGPATDTKDMGAKILTFPNPAVVSDGRARPDPISGSEVAEVRVALRPLRRSSVVTGSSTVAVDAVVRALAGAEQVRSAGPSDDPVIEAWFRGTGAAVWAAGAVDHACGEVRRLGGFAPAGAVAEGIEATADSGARVRVGDPTGVADRLIARAADGQVLLAGAGWCARRGIQALPSTGTADALAVPVWILREVR